MSRYHTLHAGEWVKVVPFITRRFVPWDPTCEICGGLSCAPGWMSFKTKRFRCKKCFDPYEGLSKSATQESGMEV